MLEALERLVLSLLPLLIVVLAFYLMLRPIPGMESVFRGIGQVVFSGIGLGVRLTAQGVILVVATAVDAVITTGLSTYHAATARPHLVPEDWAAFALRFNDRLHRTVLGNF